MVDSFIFRSYRDYNSPRIRSDPGRGPIIIINYRENVSSVINDKGGVRAQPGGSLLQFRLQFLTGRIPIYRQNDFAEPIFRLTRLFSQDSDLFGRAGGIFGDAYVRLSLLLNAGATGHQDDAGEET